MAHILLMVVGTDGDFRPMARIGVALKARGHDVTMIANCYFAERARAAGLRFAAFDTPEEYERFIADGAYANSPQGSLVYIQRHILPKIHAQYALIAEHCRSRDTILMPQNQFFILAQIMAEKLGIAVAPVFLAPSFFSGMVVLEQVIGSTFGEAINLGRAELELAPVRDWGAWLRRNRMYLALWPEWYAAVDPGWGPKLIQAGFVVPDTSRPGELSERVRSFLAAGEPPILISGGTGRFVGAAFYAAGAEACRLLGRRGILATRHADLVPQELPPGVAWFEELPFASLLPHVAAIIHHGGIGTIVQALAAGVPQMVLPLGADRPDNAERLERIGVGRFLLRSHWRPDVVAEALRQLLADPVARNRCRDAARQVRETDALATVCAAIGELVAGGEAAPDTGSAEDSARQAVSSPGADQSTGRADALRQVDRLSQERLELLARMLKRKQRDEAGEGEPTIPRQPRTGAATFPLSFAQQRLWLLEQWAPGTPAYHLPGALRLDGPLDRPALRRSLAAIMQRHEVLRTTIRLQDGSPYQHIPPRAPALALPLIDLRALPATRQDAVVRALSQEVARRPFDLAVGPLLRLALLQLAPASHVLLLTLHHIVADGWSLERLVRELSALYAAARAGQPPALPALPIQYADFAVWQRRRLAGAARDLLLAYWRERLAGAPQLLGLPTDYPRPAEPHWQGARVPLALDAALAEQLRGLAQRSGATLFMIVLAAFQVLLSRYSNQTDMLVGAPVAGRTRRELEALLGCFVNTLVLRADVSGNPPFAALLAQVRQTCLDAYAHQELPFEQLVEALAPARDGRAPPLVQVVLAWQAAPLPTLKLDDVRAQAEALPGGASKFDLTLDLVETGDGVRGAIEYACALFAAPTIIRLAGHLRTLLAGIVAEPARRLADLPLLTIHERQQVLSEWNDSFAGFRVQDSEVRSYRTDGCIHRLIAAQAAHAPDVVAVVFEPTNDERRTTNAVSESFVLGPSSFVTHLTYAALDARANQLAHELRTLGVGPDALVGLCIDRAVEMIVGILGILKAGGAYLPLDPAYPAERISFMLEDSGATVLLTNDERPTTNDQIDHLVTLSPCHLVNLGAGWPSIARQPVTAPDDRTSAGNLAYVIYTSGSTGRPKGVMVTRGGLLNLCYGLRTFFADPAVQHAGLITSISFDISVNQIFPALLFGRTLQIIPETIKYDRHALLAELRRQHIHLLDGVPSYIQMILGAGDAPPRTALRYLLIGGEKLEPRLLELIFAQLGAQVAVVNIYGLTEISDVNAFSVLRSGDRAAQITIGRPLQNNRLYLLNPQHQPQPVGVVGELYIAGESLSRGYLGRPDLTAERFVPNPFTDFGFRVPSGRLDFGLGSSIQNRVPRRGESRIQNGERLVRTGDLGRWRADGQIELLGRRDHQVKLRGFRIEVGEVEAALAAHAGLRECVVVAREERLVAYIVPTTDDRPSTMDDRMETAPSSIVYRLSSSNDESEPSSFRVPSGRRNSSLATELRTYLKQMLPEHMIPSAFVVLAALPKTPNGKVDRNALPPPDPARSADESYVAPRTAVEAVLARIWAQMLQVERVGVEDSFFALGGHSLLAVRLLAHLRTTFQIALPFRSLFEAPTVAELARVITAHEARPGQSERIARILQRLDGMTETETRALLARKEQEANAG